jgi:hypothetical protein
MNDALLPASGLPRRGAQAATASQLKIPLLFRLRTENRIARPGEVANGGSP